MRKTVYFFAVCFLFVSLFSFSSEKKENLSADVAVVKLLEGNKRFIEEKYSNANINSDYRKELIKGQHPFAIVVTCSDSRVAPELLFDQGLGDLFVIRTAGEVVDKFELGSIEYAIEHLGVKLVVILGHESCGAVEAVVKGGEAEGNIAYLIEEIKPAVDMAKKQKGNIMDNAIVNNVNLIIEKINKNSKIIREEKEVKVLGAVYSLTNNKVEFVK